MGAPKDFFIAPVFAAKKQFGTRQVEVKGKLYKVGGFDPFNPDARPPALSVQHARALFVLLSFRDRKSAKKRIAEDDPRNNPQNIFFSMTEFCRRYAASNGGRYAREILKTLGDLANAYISITDLTTQRVLIYRLIERLEIEHKVIKRRDAKLAESCQLELWFNYCQLSPEFYAMLKNIVELRYLKLEVFTAIRSPIAQAIYLYIPSRAARHTEVKPFEITLSTLMRQISIPVPVHKSVRKKVFTQHENEGRSILQQLDGLETFKGRFRVKLVETANGDDFKLLTWIDPDGNLALPEPREDSKLYQAFLKGGRAPENWGPMLKRESPLSNYERDMLELTGIPLGPHQRFLEKAKAILGQAIFCELLAEAKDDHLEGVKARKNPAAKLIYRLMTAIKRGVGQAKP